MGKSIKIAIARMMAVLMVMTLIPFDMLVPARVAKAADVQYTVSADGTTTTWDFSLVSANITYTANDDLGGGLKAVGCKTQSGALRLNKNSMNVPLKDTTKSVKITLTITSPNDSRWVEIGSENVKVYHTSKNAGSNQSCTNKEFVGEFPATAFTTIETAKYLTLTSTSSSGQTDIVSLSIKESTEEAGSDTTQPPTASVTFGTEAITGTEVTEGAKLKLTSATDGAVIYYTSATGEKTPDDPTSESDEFPADGLDLNEIGKVTIKAIAIKGEKSSSIVSFTYTVKAEVISEPTPSIDSDTKVAKDTKLALETETADADIYYTLNGDEPTESSTKYDGEFSLGSEAGSVTVKAIAIKGTKKSSVVTFTYTITGTKLATPTATPSAGEVARGTEVTLSCSNDGGVIYYTTDGSTPNKNSTKYASPIEITKDMTIKAIATSDTNADSDVVTFTYTIKKPNISVASDSDSKSILSGVALNGDITFKNASGAEVFDIAVKAEKVTSPSNDVKTAAEALKENGGEILYYNFTLTNTANDTISVVKGANNANISIKMPYSIASSEANKLNEIIVLHGTEKVTSVGNVTDGFTFSMDEAGAYTVIVNPRPEGQSLVKITEWAGYEEGAYAEWKAVEGADGYMAYVALSGGEWKRIDDELIREYKDYWRVDTVGLAKGNYFIKIDAVTLSADKKTATVIASNTTEVLKVTNYDRSGFAFSEVSKTKTGSGAYNEDGTLKAGAKVLYVNNENFNTVTWTVQDSKGKDYTFTGIQEIVYEGGVIKVAPDTPIDIRIIGTIDITGFPKTAWKSSAEGLQIKSPNSYTNRNLTIEGIGEDAAVSGFGFLVKNCGNVEFRNFAVMNFADDGISLDGDNSNVWIHDMDFFYGNPGGDSDQAKGDGTIDLKDNTMYCTFSYNHFWDSGKCSLCGMKSESGPNYITYHHNWFDHSDSRHPRIRTMSVHVYNNYFDGNSKYGVGVTYGGSAFVEANYFRNCKNPMLISMQGTDAKGAGTFSKESGGIIKAYNNHIEGAQSFIPYSPNSTDFDAYVVENTDEKVPESVKAKAGGSSYDNFDTASTMYDYVADMPEEAKEKVVSNAGRLNGGDLQWIFDNTKEDTNYGLISGLKEKVVNYKPSVVDIGGKVEGDPNVVEMPGGGSTNVPVYTPKNVSDPEADPSSRQVEKGATIALKCKTEGALIYYTLDGSTPTTTSLLYEDVKPIVITESTTVRAIAVYGGEQSDVKSFYYTVIGEGTGVNPGPGGGDDEFETRIYMFNPEADGMEADFVLPANVTSYGTDGYFTIDNAGGKAKISLISTSTPPNPKDAPADTHGGQEEYLLRFSFGEKTTKDSKQAIRFTNEYAAKVYIGAYVSKTDATAAKTKIYLDTDENAAGPCVNASTEYVFDVEAGEHVIYAKDDGTAYILYVVVEERIPTTPTPPAGTVADPVASPVSGNVPKGTKVTLSTTTEGAKILYTLDGTDPTTAGNEYTTAIDLGNEVKKVTIKAVAVLGDKKSQVVTYEYQITDQYVITIDKLDGTEATVKTIDAGTALTVTDLPATLTREGYTFQGWVDENGDIITVPYTPTKSMTIKARWQKIVGEDEYAIVIDRLDGTDPVEKVIEAGTALTETDLPATLTREGYTFQGWVDEENNAITVPYTPTKSMTIKAKWQENVTENQYTITIDQQNDTDPVEKVIKAGTALTETDLPATLTREGYTFQGWVDEEGNAITVPYTPTKSMTIKAKWQSNTTEPEVGLHVKLAVPNATYVYTGSAIKPAIIVTNNGERLIEGVDYTVKYSNNIKACEWGKDEDAPKNAPKITVTGKGNLTSSTFTNFTIKPKALNAEDVKAGTVTVAKNSKATPVLVYNGVKLGAKDYTYKKPEEKNKKFGDVSKEEAETFEIELEGAGNYAGSRKVTVKAVKKDDLKTFTVSVGKVDLTYNGASQLLPEDAITVQDKKTKETLKNDKDHTYYEVLYSGDTTSAGTVKFSVVGMGDYTGTVSKTYTIKPLKDNSRFYIDKASIKASYGYNSAGVTLGEDLKVYYGSDTKGTKLQEGADYKVTYSNNKKVGKGKYTITFLGNFKGSKISGETFEIVAASLKDSKAQVEAADKVFKNAGIYKSVPIVTINGVALKASDYKVEYGVADSNGNVADGTWSQKPRVTAAGTTIKVKVTGKGSYNTDCVYGEYQVCDKGTKKDLSSAKVTFYEKAKYDSNNNETDAKKVTKLPYTGKEVVPGDVVVQVKDGKTWVTVPKSQYKVVYVNNVNKGKATAVITAIGDEYVGSKTAKFSIVARNLKNDEKGLLDNLFRILGM